MNSHFHSAKKPEEGPFRSEKFFVLYPPGTSKNQSENPFVKNIYQKSHSAEKSHEDPLGWKRLLYNLKYQKTN